MSEIFLKIDSLLATYLVSSTPPPPHPSPPTTTPAMTLHSARSIHSAILIYIIYISGCYIIFRAQKVHATPILILESKEEERKRMEAERKKVS